MKFELVHNAERVLKHAWSMRLALICAVLSAVEAGLAVVQGNPPIDPVHFAFIVTAVSGASAVARLVAQVKVSGGTEEQA